MPLPVNMSVIDPHYNPSTGQDDPNYNGGAASINYGATPGIASSITPYSPGYALGAETGPPVDHTYDQYGGKTAYNNLVAGFGNQKTNIYGTANEAAATSGRNLNSSILDLIQGTRTGQRTVDNAAINNELAKRQGVNSTYGMVGRGIRSGGVQLANRNAGDSSATGALARAYGDIGRRQLSNIGNQYEQGNREVGIQQQNLDDQRATGSRKIHESEENSVDAIVADARNRLAQLDADMLNASLPERINIENEKNAIHNQVSGILQPYLAQLDSGLGGIHAMSQDERRGEASKLFSAGTDLGSDAFNFTDQTPAQFQNGPFSSELPLFLSPRSKKVA